MGKISQYIEERAKWSKFGKPIREPEQTEALFKICESCIMFKRFNDDSGECAECGCHLKKQGNWLNKLAWGTTRCPLPEPKWVESDIKYTEQVDFSSADLETAEQEHVLESHEANKSDVQPCNCK